MRHDKPETMCSLEHERRKAWQEGYTAGWKDQECDFPQYTTDNPDPLSCHNRGQRFKYVGQDQLAYKHQSNRADILRTLKLKAETQPTFDLEEANQ